LKNKLSFQSINFVVNSFYILYFRIYFNFVVVICFNFFSSTWNLKMFWRLISLRIWIYFTSNSVDICQSSSVVCWRKFMIFLFHLLLLPPFYDPFFVIENWNWFFLSTLSDFKRATNIHDEICTFFGFIWGEKRRVSIISILFFHFMRIILVT
jgi:hypothetical protein